MTYITLKDRSLTLDACCDHLVVKQNNKLMRTIPLDGVQQINFLHAIDLPSRLISSALSHQVSLVVINSHQPQHSFVIAAGGRGELLYHQANIPDALREKLALWIQQLRWKRMLHYLQQWKQQQPKQRKSLHDAAKKIQQILALSHSANLQQLHGYEGAAQQAWFLVISSQGGKFFQTTCRSRRPPQDPFNACLSYCYFLLYQQAITASLLAGLEPSLGIQHVTLNSRQALACDLMEPLRPAVDRWLCQQLKNQQIDYRGFIKKKGQCLLDKRNRQKLLAIFMKKSTAWQRQLLLQAKQLRIALNGEINHVGNIPLVD